METKRRELIDQLINVDDILAETVILEEKSPTPSDLRGAIRRATIAEKFSPVFMGAAYRNKGVQTLLDGVIDYLPNPSEVENYALDLDKGEEKVLLVSDSGKPFVGLAFKLEEGRFGQLTYLRVYQGTISRGAFIININTGKRIKVPRLVRMHAGEMEEITSASAGEICAMFGVDCYSGNTFTEGSIRYAMTSMHVPSPVISLSVETKEKKMIPTLSKALLKFQKEDPTFTVTYDPDSKETLISGMGELHLEIYAERMRREYQIPITTGKPQVAFRETIVSEGQFDYQHKKQTGGQGQYARMSGHLEPILMEENKMENEFVDGTVGGSIPGEYMPAIEKGFRETLDKGLITGFPIVGVRMVVEGGDYHSVDSSDLAFRICSSIAFKQGFTRSLPIVLEPIMTVEVTAPIEYQSGIIGALNKKRGIVLETNNQADFVAITAEVPLNTMFGFSTELRSMTQGKGEFTMEYKKYQRVPRDLQEELAAAFVKKNQQS